MEASAIFDLFPTGPTWTTRKIAPIERLWVIGSQRESKEALCRRLLNETVLLSIDSGRRLVEPQDHVAIYDAGSDEFILLGPTLPSLPESDEIASRLVDAFLDHLLSLAIQPLLALSFRGGIPAAYLGGERTTVATALRYATDPRSSIGRARACGMALQTLDNMDDALVGVFERERASGRELDTVRAVAFCESAREAFWRAGLERPRRSSDGEVRRLWGLLQVPFPFAMPLHADRPRRLGYAANLVLGGLLDIRARNEPVELRYYLPRRVLGRASRDRLAVSLPAAHLIDDVLVAVVDRPRKIARATGDAICVEVMLESEFFVELGIKGQHGPRGPQCALLVEATGASIICKAPAVRVGEWSRIELVPTGAEKIEISFKFAPAGLDMVAGSITFRLGDI